MRQSASRRMSATTCKGLIWGFMVGLLTSVMGTAAHAEGTVTVTKNGNEISIQGDAESNGIDITYNSGLLTVVPRPFRMTTINSDIVFPYPTDKDTEIRMQMRGGDDDVVIQKGQISELKKFYVHMGAGDDRLEMRNSSPPSSAGIESATTITLDMGSGEDGLRLTRLRLDAELKVYILGGSGADVVLLQLSEFRTTFGLGGSGVIINGFRRVRP